MEILSPQTETKIKFVLTGKFAGKTKVVGRRYQFVKGEMVVPAKIAVKLQRILCRYYGCKMLPVQEEPEQVAEQTGGDPKPGPDVGKATTNTAKASNQPN